MHDLLHADGARNQWRRIAGPEERDGEVPHRGVDEHGGAQAVAREGCEVGGGGVAAASGAKDVKKVGCWEERAGAGFPFAGFGGDGGCGEGGVDGALVVCWGGGGGGGVGLVWRG